MSEIAASATAQPTASRWTELWRKEDWWAIWLGLGIVGVGLVLFSYGLGLRWLAVLPPRWASTGQLIQHFAENWLRYVAQFAFWSAIFTAALSTMGFKPREFLRGFAFLYALAVVVFVIGQWEIANFYGATHIFRDQLERTSRPATKAGVKLITITAGDLSVKANYQDFQRYVEADLSMAADGEATLERAATLLRSRGTLTLIWVFDPIEERLPLPGRYPLTDGLEHVVLDTGMPAVRDAHSRDFAERRKRLQRWAALPGARCHAVRTGAELFAALERSFAGV